MDLESLAEWAHILREGKLLRTEEERLAVRRVEVAYAKHQAERAGDDWERVFRIWDELYQIYPVDWEIADKRFEALCELVIAEADRWALSEGPASAIQYLQGRRSDGEGARILGAPKVLLKLAELHARQGSFQQAEQCLKQAKLGNISSLTDRVADVESLIKSLQIANKAKSQVTDAQDAVGVLRALKEALENPDLTHPEVQDKLRRERDEIFETEHRTILNDAQAALEQGTREGRIKALGLYLHLSTLEELADIPSDRREAFQKIEELEEYLPEISRYVISRAKQFSAGNYSLRDALDVTAKLREDLTALIRIDPDLDPDLEAQRTRMAEAHERLRQFEDEWKKACNPQLWETAVRTADFTGLERHRDELYKLAGDLQEAGEFDQRLNEWEMASRHLEEGIQRLRSSFVQDKFEEAIGEIERLKQYPSEHGWEYIDGVEYKRIFNLANTRARIVDSFTNPREEIVGWDEIEQAAKERREERDKWREWEKTLEGRFDEAKRTSDTAREFEEEFLQYLPKAGGHVKYLQTKYPGTARLLGELDEIISQDLRDEEFGNVQHVQDFSPDEEKSYQKRYEVWEQAHRALKSLLAHISSGGPGRPARCAAAENALNKAKTIEKESRDFADYAAKIVKRCEEAISLFPTARDLELVKFNETLRRAVILKGDIIGPSNREQKGLLDAYRSIPPTRRWPRWPFGR